jgi:hypothetical protein
MSLDTTPLLRLTTMASDLARKAAEIASHDVGIREQGQNDGPRIRQYMYTVGIRPPLPYCAAAVSTWIHEAAQELDMPEDPQFMPSASALRMLAKNTKLAFEPETLTPDMIPCIFILNHDGIHGHAGLIVGMNDTGGLQTIEANTNADGSREGDGVYAKAIRNINQLAGCIRIQ